MLCSAPSLYHDSLPSILSVSFFSYFLRSTSICVSLGLNSSKTRPMSPNPLIKQRKKSWRRSNQRLETLWESFFAFLLLLETVLESMVLYLRLMSRWADQVSLRKYLHSTNLMDQHSPHASSSSSSSWMHWALCCQLCAISPLSPSFSVSVSPSLSPSHSLAAHLSLFLSHYLSICCYAV